jgi:hypothetical protein
MKPLLQWLIAVSDEAPEFLTSLPTLLGRGLINAQP